MPFERLHNHSHKSILIVEDDVSIRDVLKMVLEMDGYLVYIASNGEEALAKLRALKENAKPCLILTDLMMPKMDGWQFIRATEINHTLVGIPIVVISAENHHELPKNRVFVRKPFSIDAIIKLAHDACHKATTDLSPSPP